MRRIAERFFQIMFESLIKEFANSIRLWTITASANFKNTKSNAKFMNAITIESSPLIGKNATRSTVLANPVLKYRMNDRRRSSIRQGYCKCITSQAINHCQYANITTQSLRQRVFSTHNVHFETIIIPPTSICRSQATGVLPTRSYFSHAGQLAI